MKQTVAMLVRGAAGLSLVLLSLAAWGRSLSLTELPQTTAEPPIPVPATASCTETVLTHTFANSYYVPGVGQHLAAKCPGPWAAVVLGVDVSVSGVQYDRIFDIYAGPVLLLSSSTSEPASELPDAVTYWHVDTDVSRFAGLLGSDQTITTILNNVNDSTYTGQYAVTVTLTYYATGAGAPAAAVPDLIVPVFPQSAAAPGLPTDTGNDGYAGLTAPGQVYTQSLTLPQNLLSLQADVYAQGHGTCEEFWWGEPGQCGVGTPLRQVEISIDGVLAGFAPVYPVVFTGGGGPGSWSPIPSPRAWHLYPYSLDLTPFVGRLVDGKPHQFSLAVPDAAYSAATDVWMVGATLLGMIDQHAASTSGALPSPPVAASDTESFSRDSSQTRLFEFTASRSGRWTGYVTGSAGRTESTVSNGFNLQTLGTLGTLGGALTSSKWGWITSSTLSGGDGVPVTTTVSRTYVLRSPEAGGGNYQDAATTTVSGPAPSTSSYDLNLLTTSAIEANIAELETYTGTDSSGYCYHSLVTTSAGYILADQSGLPCN